MVLVKEIEKFFLLDSKNYEKLFKLTNIVGEMLLIIWTFSYTKATPNIWMANFQSLFIKKRLLSLCTSLFVSFHQQYTIKNIAIVWGEALCELQYGGENFQKTQISIVSKFAQSIMSLRNMSTPNYSNTSHIRKGINYSIQNFLFLLFVNHLLFRKQKGGFFWKERQRSACRKGTRKFPVSTIPSSTAQPTTTATVPPKRTRGIKATI